MNNEPKSVSKKEEDKALARYVKLMRKHNSTITSIDEILNEI